MTPPNALDQLMAAYERRREDLEILNRHFEVTTQNERDLVRSGVLLKLLPHLETLRTALLQESAREGMQESAESGEAAA